MEMGWLSMASIKKTGEKVSRATGSFSSKVKDYLNNSPIVAKLTPEQEEEMIDRIAGKISKFGMEMPAGIVLGIFKPLSYVGSNLILLPASPFLYMFGINGYPSVSFLEKGENVEKLIKKIEDLDRARIH